ncbi:TonB family protein [Rhodoblastus acidophilus]|uniref:TonB family protein n=1 Tax=Rhodoblastus acidophilus TaxID=1074 RepID=UPI002224BB76|nr:TonB family protein [Rhodoblastus acidophilus]MCW2283785.1 TonB family protein [Rhodoblastus acidophilus]MCW2332866.1 TonB family protein [Rhodoblastus acidophilus]
MTELALNWSETPAPRRLSATWLIAGGVALALHGGAAAVALMDRDTELDDAVGAAAIEIGLDYEAPRNEPSFLPPGQEAQESRAALETPDQKIKTDSALPEAQMTQAEEAEQQAAPKPLEKPDEKTEEAKQNTVATQAAVEAEAAAAPSSEAAKPSNRSRAPVLGVGETARRTVLTWQKQLVAHLDRAKRYPAEGGGRGATVKVRFRIDRMGRLQMAESAATRQDPAFEAAALAMLKRADPVPPPPPDLADAGLTFSLPVVFRAQPKR